jgi:hypothetical protein
MGSSWRLLRVVLASSVRAWHKYDWEARALNEGFQRCIGPVLVAENRLVQRCLYQVMDETGSAAIAT